ncbi:MAG TPA: tRNA (adenosine(37)-N6)-threonylcarbamoyltransferase complex dimerization subunit type 1 TsaB, partial [Thioalkalivibrio sp.]|nr:tRNA (adenosine(37)-N6)-threonylcarbamoyltransferase complex dimerization subunit type 1 TsaB [Thioalkalivibrio sp.]
MRLIALETATEACSAALWVDGEVRFRMEREATRRHGELILQQVDQLLAEAGLKPGDLDAVAAGRGPGAFTGVRLGLGVAQGLAFAVGCPVVPVSTLAALAQQAFDQGADQVLALLDARMGEVYWSVNTRDAG